MGRLIETILLLGAMQLLHKLSKVIRAEARHDFSAYVIKIGVSLRPHKFVSQPSAAYNIVKHLMAVTESKKHAGSKFCLTCMMVMAIAFCWTF